LSEENVNPNPTDSDNPTEPVETAATTQPTSDSSESRPAPETPKVTVSEEFDWAAIDQDQDDYSPQEREALEKEYESTLTTVEENAILIGTVVGITSTDVVLNIGFKSDGLVPLSEFRDMPDLRLGAEVEVYVEKREDAKGHLVLSRKNAKLMRAWEGITDAYNNDKILTGKIVSKTKGGLIVDVFGLETFLPGSQIDVKPISDYDAFIGKQMEFKVVKINETIKNAVVSHKALIESDLEEQRMAIIAQLEKGQVLEGTIKNITDFGAFIDLGGVDGLLYITDISWGRVNHPSEVLSVNQKINVVVLDFDNEKKRISLGKKQLEPHPWQQLDESFQVGAVIKGKVVNVEDYGAFLEVRPGVEGLIHVSEVSWSNHPINAREFFTPGQELEAKIVNIDRDERKMSLSLKQLKEDPWQKVDEKYPIGSRQVGLVRNITNYGVFVELDEYIGGMVHVSDLSWLRRYNHPNEFIKPGEKLEVMVMEIDKESRKVSLSHKHLEEDPWDAFENVFYVGSVHEATVVRREDKGAVIQLPYGLEAFVPNRHLKRADGSFVEAEQVEQFKIIEFDRSEKRLIASHSRFLTDQEAEAKTAEKSEKHREVRSTKEAISRINKSSEKSTLADLGVLEDLKKQMVKEEKAAAEKLANTGQPPESPETGDEKP
jgi:small subunit ribosomal protein S1